MPAASPTADSGTADSPNNPIASTSSGVSRLMSTMRRSLSYTTSPKKGQRHNSDPIGMLSTAAEHASTRPTRYAGLAAYAPPTPKQIAMGLHTSRTPHLGPSRNPHAHSAPATQADRKPAMLPPPPARSSMKKPGTKPHSRSAPKPKLSDDSSTRVGPGLAMTPSSSRSTLTSGGPATPRSSSTGSLKVRMARLLPGLVSTSAPSSGLSSPVSEYDETPRKAVRFSQSVLGLDAEAASVRSAA